MTEETLLMRSSHLHDGWLEMSGGGDKEDSDEKNTGRAALAKVSIALKEGVVEIPAPDFSPCLWVSQVGRKESVTAWDFPGIMSSGPEQM
ncbi:unnamed protein product [Allacma fusca]|uniref:Uncharacterized protein n=1 Tax=Allacma fusca TaxID=39272 RepID=A0A8J2NVD3_9HEXA|nr:unnamed protein product [Allacma fusca]